MPWSLQPENKAPLQKLMDILIHFPPWIKSCTRFWTQAFPSESDMNGILEAQRGLRVSRELLDTWWEAFQAERGNEWWETPMPASMLEETDSGYMPPAPWKTHYHFKSLKTAHSFIYYHATRVLCVGVLRGIEALDLNVDPAHVARMAAESRASAMEICRATDYLLLPRHDGAGSVYLIFPLRLAWKAVGGDTPEGAWLRQVADSIGSGAKGGWAGLPMMLYGDFNIENGLESVRDG